MQKTPTAIYCIFADGLIQAGRSKQSKYACLLAIALEESSDQLVVVSAQAQHPQSLHVSHLCTLPALDTASWALAAIVIA